MGTHATYKFRFDLNTSHFDREIHTYVQAQTEKCNRFKKKHKHKN